MGSKASRNKQSKAAAPEAGTRGAKPGVEKSKRRARDVADGESSAVEPKSKRRERELSDGEPAAIEPRPKRTKSPSKVRAEAPATYRETPERPAKPYIGGQAVIEGVMMRAPGCMSVAVRRPDGTIVITEGPMVSRLATSKIWKWPGFRGVATLVESMSIGYRALDFSAQQQLTDEELKANAAKGGASGKGAIMLSTAAALLLFIALPQGAATGLSSLLDLDLSVSQWQFHALTGGFKLLIFTLYLAAISRLEDVRRVFQYHGAEHKTIFAYEQGLELTVENVRKQSTLHPRCGTTFLIVVIIVSIVAGSLVTPLLLPDLAEGWRAQVGTLAIRIGLLPFIAAASYELQRLSARYCTTGPLRVLLLPGFLFQKITTREPTDDQIEIAITAMRTAMWREDVGTRADTGEPVAFADFESFLDGVSDLRPLSEAA